MKKQCLSHKQYILKDALLKFIIIYSIDIINFVKKWWMMYSVYFENINFKYNAVILYKKMRNIFYKVKVFFFEEIKFKNSAIFDNSKIK